MMHQLFALKGLVIQYSPIFLIFMLFTYLCEQILENFFISNGHLYSV